MGCVCAVENLCQVSKQLKGNVRWKLELRFKVEGSNEMRKGHERRACIVRGNFKERR